MNIPFVDLKTQYHALKPEIDQALLRVLESSAFSAGPFVASFEKAFAQAQGVDRCLAVSSGTAALHLVGMALGLKPGDEVIMPSNTFFATAEGVSLTGAKPVFVDCDPLYYNLDPGKLERALTPASKAVFAVHLYGQPAPLGPILDFCQKKGLPLVEDCAQAHLATYQGRPVGSFGVAGCFSFYPGKNLGAYGEGGAVVTGDAGLHAKMAALGNHGSRERYVHQYVGHNYRMDGFQGAILEVKLKYLEAWTQARRRAAGLYRQHLAGVPQVVLPSEAPGARHVYHLFVVRAPRRDELKKYLEERGVGVGIHYPIPCHKQAAYAQGGHARGDLPVCEAYASEILSLPMFAEISEEQIAHVARLIGEFYA
ncbi:MAG: DegT/DnrJ/EryC1/StrS family aminotransferase [Desulfarculus sp.]|nr:DegT/DnrJ/EryC1/StrS family aminotransferase [Desulfarculus sp.]